MRLSSIRIRATIIPFSLWGSLTLVRPLPAQGASYWLHRKMGGAFLFAGPATHSLTSPLGRGFTHVYIKPAQQKDNTARQQRALCVAVLSRARDSLTSALSASQSTVADCRANKRGQGLTSTCIKPEGDCTAKKEANRGSSR